MKHNAASYACAAAVQSVGGPADVLQNSWADMHATPVQKHVRCPTTGPQPSESAGQCSGCDLKSAIHMKQYT
jgi:hypothetical protein